MLFLLHSNLHYAVLAVHLHRLYDSHGATSVDMTIYDSKCADSSSSSSSRLSDDAIKLRWQPQVAVVQRLLAGAGVGNTTLSVADTLEQEDGSNNCGVHSHHVHGGARKRGPRSRSASPPVHQRRSRIHEARADPRVLDEPLDPSDPFNPSDSSAASDPFVQYLHRTIQTIVPASSHK